jgi:hypothetical protein
MSDNRAESGAGGPGDYLPPGVERTVAFLDGGTFRVWLATLIEARIKAGLTPGGEMGILVAILGEMVASRVAEKDRAALARATHDALDARIQTVVDGRLREDRDYAAATVKAAGLQS